MLACRDDDTAELRTSRPKLLKLRRSPQPDMTHPGSIWNLGIAALALELGCTDADIEKAPEQRASRRSSILVGTRPQSDSKFSGTSATTCKVKDYRQSP